MKRRFGLFAGIFFFFALLVLLSSLEAQTPSTSDAVTGKVIIIPVQGEIETGLAFFIQRMIRKAEREGAVAVVLEINSNGGLISAAEEVKDTLLHSEVKTIAYVKNRALSAAALIAISCHKIVMEPGSEMGAATPIMLAGGSVQAAEAKFVSAFKAEFEASAEKRKRPTALAAAMVDKDHDELPDGLGKRGTILTLTTETARDHGYCDVIASNIESALMQLKLIPAPLERV